MRETRQQAQARMRREGSAAHALGRGRNPAVDLEFQRRHPRLCALMVAAWQQGWDAAAEEAGREARQHGRPRESDAAPAWLRGWDEEDRNWTVRVCPAVQS